MTLSDFAAIGSFMSGVAVVITLIFLLIQMRQTNKNQRALMQQGRSNRAIEVLLSRTEPHLSEALTHIWRGDTEMEASQFHAVNAFNIALFWHLEDSFLQHQAELLDEVSWATEVATLRGFLTIPAIRVSWKISRLQSSGAYRAFVDSLMNETKTMKPFDEAALWKALMAQELAAAA